MHRVLLVAELLDNIFGNLSAEFERLIGGPNDGTLLALATTCRTFKEPALNALWENLPEIDTLIKCLPRDAWEASVDQETRWGRPANAFVEFKRPLTPTDWTIIRRYAPRVRRLHQVSLDSHRSSYTKLLVLSLAPPDSVPLLPNLKALEWTGMQPDTAPFVRTFLSASLESLHYGIGSTIPDTHVLASVGAFCPAIKDASVFSYKKISGGIEAFSLSVCRWEYLQVLQCEELTDDALVHIAGLPNLRELHITLTPGTPFRALRMQVQGSVFTKLASLDVNAADLGFVAAFVSAFELSPANVTMLVAEEANACSDRVAAVLKALSKVGRALNHVEIAEEELYWYYNPPAHTFTVRNSVIDMSTLRPLLGCAALRVIDLDTRCSVVLTDAELIDLARALPLLETLSVNSMRGWNAPAAVTFYGVLSVARLCPCLTRLGIQFDGMSTEKIHPPEGASAHDNEEGDGNFNLEELWVGNSRVDDPETVATILYDAMPGLRRVFGWCSPPGLGDEEDEAWRMEEEVYGRRWKEVEAIVAQFRREDNEDSSTSSGAAELSADEDTNMGEEE
ncbi:hypothetical protein CONPUDRAFT_169777 [Coniophora puteana RWD-64-598 SS2]|uniref:F-box domain-containing protein n=1 Tax=Coniophora puteana (strain RWD-64-598) TaxID=741705 RepID=A0A5M3M621_CONPW|nr:uncharacterized protein CONPUDRAFT_169777 [Coniophora puteana RWD-64-598 SS2]EIW74832.1 hypothetical protein CONPUDRAFT_169777 [Coniophora puteana RWD-64-598 SS2]